VNLVFFKMNSYSKIFFSWQKFPSFLSSVMKFKKSSIVLNKNWLKQSPIGHLKTKRSIKRFFISSGELKG
jgi:hypothetical protein